MNGWLLGNMVALFCALSGYAQTPPPNDNFSNRTVLGGTNLTFSGTLAGATLESSNEVVALNPRFGSAQATGSVWWSWTAPATTVLTLQQLPPTANGGLAAFFVYTATNNTLSGLALPPLGMTFFYNNGIYGPQSLSIPVMAGTEYELQLVGNTVASDTFRLFAQNAPVIIQQPQSLAVDSNSTALFYVFAASTNQTNLTFQWLFGTNVLSGETAPMLALSNIDSTMAGPYTVVVSNSAGFTVSDAATLTVSQSNVPIYLSVTDTQPGSLLFSLTGENGRYYQILSSPDLVNWSPDFEFPMNFGTNSHTTASLVFNSGSPLTLIAANDSSQKFFRALPYVITPESTDACDNHLEEIRVAKELWSRDYEAEGAYGPVTPQVTDILPYLPRRVAPVCPIDTQNSFITSYGINDLMTDPMCQVYPNQHSIFLTPQH